MSTRAQIINIITVQLLLLGYTLYADWDPFLLFFIYVADLFLATLFGMVLCVARGGIKFVPWALFTASVVCGLATGLLFAGIKILTPDFIEGEPITLNSFISVVLFAASACWVGILINSSTTITRLIKKRGEDSMFLTLYPTVRLFPLFPVVVIGGFITLLGFPQAVIIGMTLAHMGTDLMLIGLRSMSDRLQRFSNTYAPVKN